jgi:hypothetical protein
MMEQWNSGIMGSGKMEKWVIGKIPLDREVNKVNIRITSLLKQTFQYSTIPLFHVRGRSSGLEKKPLFSISCTNSETYI